MVFSPLPLLSPWCHSFPMSPAPAPFLPLMDLFRTPQPTPSSSTQDHSGGGSVLTDASSAPSNGPEHCAGGVSEGGRASRSFVVVCGDILIFDGGQERPVSDPGGVSAHKSFIKRVSGRITGPPHRGAKVGRGEAKPSNLTTSSNRKLRLMILTW